MEVAPGNVLQDGLGGGEGGIRHDAPEDLRQGLPRRHQHGGPPHGHAHHVKRQAGAALRQPVQPVRAVQPFQQAEADIFSLAAVGAPLVDVQDAAALFLQKIRHHAEGLGPVSPPAVDRQDGPLRLLRRGPVARQAGTVPGGDRHRLRDPFFLGGHGLLQGGGVVRSAPGPADAGLHALEQLRLLPVHPRPDQQIQERIARQAHEAAQHQARSGGQETLAPSFHASLLFMTARAFRCPGSIHQPTLFIFPMTYSQTTTRSSAENTAGKLSENRIWAEAGNSSSPSHRKKRSQRPGRNSRA